MRTLLPQRLESTEHASGMQPGQQEGKARREAQRAGWMQQENCPKDGHWCLQLLQFTKANWGSPYLKTATQKQPR